MNSVRHEVRPDGCTLRSVLELDGSTVEATLQWPDARTAAENMAFTKHQVAAELVAAYLDGDRYPGQDTVVRRASVGPVTFMLTVMSGPPTWWIPRLKFDLEERWLLTIGASWLRRGYYLSVTAGER